MEDGSLRLIDFDASFLGTKEECQQEAQRLLGAFRGSTSYIVPKNRISGVLP